MLGQVTHGALELVRAGARLERLLQLVLLHLRAETYLRTVVLAARFILTGAWE